MQPLISAMTTLRQVFAAALKSLLRGRSLLQALLAFWTSPSDLKSRKANARSASRNGKASSSSSSYPRTIDDFLREAHELLIGPTDDVRLRQLSLMLKAQFREGLLKNPECMLPSYNHQLPNGYEQGQYLALDVGGSTLRVALVELRSRGARGSESGIVRMQSFKIDPAIKDLVGVAFFEWMAARIVETVEGSGQSGGSEQPLLMGLAWSFPIEQTSLQGGRLRNMGKGFLAAEGLLGQDLGGIIKRACKEQGLDVEVAAIVNDSTAALLSKAYTNESTRFSLILGTGVNVAAHLPVPTIAREKYGIRPDGWFETASHVVVNTEVSMFGKGILPVTRWDAQLLANHPRPDFQPLEHMVSGFYLGEVCRHALVEAIHSTGIFGGVLPPSLATPYSLDTETLSIIEADTSSTLEAALAAFRTHHPSPIDPTVSDVRALRTLASYVSRRSSALVATSVFSLWQLKAETEAEYLQAQPPAAFARAARAELALPRTVVSYTGSVVENYPGYLASCQEYVDRLVTAAGGLPGAVDLVAAKESSLLGVAVALACVEEGRTE